MHALDYLVAGAVMIILIMFSYSILTPTVYIPITHIKEQQLDVLAERLIDKILLTPGIPYDWGLVETNPVESNQNDTLDPDSDITVNGWTVEPSSSQAHAVLSDEDDNTYVYTDRSGSVLEMNISDHYPEPSEIINLTVYLRVKGTGKITITLETNKDNKHTCTIDSADWENLTINSEVFLPKIDLNEIKINDLKIKIESKKKGKKVDIYISKLWIYVEFRADYSVAETRELRGFGLALCEDAYNLDEPYILDKYKVLRLTNASIYLDPLDVADCLGLMEDGHLKYGFELNIVPAINVSVHSIENITIETKGNEECIAYGKLLVKAINYEGIPLANASVYVVGIAICVINQKNVTAFSIHGSGITNASGVAIIDLSDQYGDLERYQGIAFVYITYVDFYGLRQYNITSSSPIATPLLVIPTDEGIICAHNSTPGEPRGAIHMRGVYTVGFTSENEPTIYKVWVRTKGPESLNILNHGGKEYLSYTIENPEQEINSIAIYFKWIGSDRLVVVSLQEILKNSSTYGTSGYGGKK
ncbi:hypothetical protein DRO58_03680, partial [Candidatus Bathyarchaeota archaeon]